MLSLNRCNGSFNTLDNPSGRIYVPNKTEDVNLYVHKHYFFCGMVDRRKAFSISKAVIVIMEAITLKSQVPIGAITGPHHTSLQHPHRKTSG